MRASRAAVAVGVLGVIWLLGLGTPELHVALLYLAPALLLAVLFVAGRYPGERVLKLWCPEPRARRRPIGPQARPRRPASFALRGGLLLASGLAGRGPPPAVA